MERLWLQRACESGFSILSLTKVHSCHHIAAQEPWFCVWCCCWLYWCCCYQCRLVGGCLQGSCRLCYKNQLPSTRGSRERALSTVLSPRAPQQLCSLQGFYNTDCLMAALELFSSQHATSFLMSPHPPPVIAFLWKLTSIILPWSMCEAEDLKFIVCLEITYCIAS